MKERRKGRKLRRKRRRRKRRRIENDKKNERLYILHWAPYTGLQLWKKTDFTRGQAGSWNSVSINSEADICSFMKEQLE